MASTTATATATVATASSSPAGTGTENGTGNENGTLPCKKRKASNASSITTISSDGDGSTSNAVSTSTARDAGTINARDAAAENATTFMEMGAANWNASADSQCSGDIASTSTTTTISRIRTRANSSLSADTAAPGNGGVICESRRPRKKRKESHDERSISQRTETMTTIPIPIPETDKTSKTSTATTTSKAIIPVLQDPRAGDDNARIRSNTCSDAVDNPFMVLQAARLQTLTETNTFDKEHQQDSDILLPPLDTSVGANIESNSLCIPLPSVGEDMDALFLAPDRISDADTNDAAPAAASSSVERTAACGEISALDHLDALLPKEHPPNDGDEGKPTASIHHRSLRDEKNVGNTDDGDESMSSSGHVLLLDAMGFAPTATSALHDLTTTTTTTSRLAPKNNEGGAFSGSKSSIQSHAPQHQSSSLLPPPNLLDAQSTATTTMCENGADTGPPYRDRLDSTATTRSNNDRWETFAATAAATRERGDSGGTAAPMLFSGRDRCDSWMGRRDRLESWGGMSDLSVPPVIVAALGGGASTTDSLIDFPPLSSSSHINNNIPAGFGHQSLFHGGGGPHANGAIPSRISLQRDRLNSIASLGDLSLSAFATGSGGSVNNNFPINMDGIDINGDIQAFVAAAMATVGDQLMELAGEMEEVAGETMNFEDFKREMGLDNSECGDNSSVASPMIGAVSDGAAASRGRGRTWSTSSGRISVDLNAVLAAVDAGDAASGSLGLPNYSIAETNQSKTKSKESLSSVQAENSSKPNAKRRPRVTRRNLPLTRDHPDAVLSSYSAKPSVFSSQKQSQRRGELVYEQPRGNSSVAVSMSAAITEVKNLPPLKKRGKRASPDTPAMVLSSSVLPTPKISNVTFPDLSGDSLIATPMMVTSTSVFESEANHICKQSGQSSQKWESMYSSLLEFAVERRIEETKDLTEDEKKVWIWDGNVPTNHKTQDGKALGRWVNNQRSAKSKGNLKDEREDRLIAAGLKWSVVASNCWNEMLEELSTYIKDQHRRGKVWDGNVPTNYQIKTRPSGGFNGEDKNLGRWINRQRSMFQSGKLRKDRQLALEGIGLKWSMLATTSWEGMFDTLKEYVSQLKTSGVDVWDGNVPANYRTSDNPPRALGRWVNRQRSAFAKNKLKRECVDKLNQLGLKWSVHTRHGGLDDLDDGEDADGDFIDDEPIHVKAGGCDSSSKETATDSEPQLHKV